jgi:hypothetical protein
LKRLRRHPVWQAKHYLGTEAIKCGRGLQSLTRREGLYRRLPGSPISRGFTGRGFQPARSTLQVGQNCWGGRPHGIECQNWDCE